MESEQSLTPNSERDHVQRESAIPFSHRSALHALLGMSDGTGKHVYARMVPSVRYTPQPFLEAVQETGPSDFDDEAAHDPDRSSGSHGVAVQHNGPFEGQGLSLLSVPPQPDLTGASARYANPISQQRDPNATSEPNRGGRAATARVERPDQVLEEITIAVPGTSARPQHFPALAPAKQDDRPVSTTVESEGAAQARGYRRDPGSTRPPERGGRSAIERTPPSVSPLIAESADEVLGRLQGNSVPSANGDVTASIEQLRRTVRELATKVASRQARTPDETPPRQTVQTPPHAVQRVVIIKQAAPQPRASRAFWERSYLSRLSWRTLR